MNRLTSAVFCGWGVLLGIISSVAPVRAHQPDPGVSTNAAQAPAATSANPAPVPGISGQGKMRFRVLYTADRLPEEAKKVLVKAHGGFAVDSRPGRGETYFALPGAGILQMSADLKTTRLRDTSVEMKKVNLPNT